MRQIVSDTGPLLHLYEASSLNLLEYAGTITIPTAVDHEMIQAEASGTRCMSWRT